MSIWNGPDEETTAVRGTLVARGTARPGAREARPPAVNLANGPPRPDHAQRLAAETERVQAVLAAERAANPPRPPREPGGKPVRAVQAKPRCVGCDAEAPQASCNVVFLWRSRVVQYGGTNHTETVCPACFGRYGWGDGLSDLVVLPG